MSVNDELGTRMKEYYEKVPKIRLMKRVPVAIRIDGKAFHTFTRGFAKPFDTVLMAAMQETMKYLCENIQGCVLGYTQSDEITLILVDYQTFDTSAWFDYEVQKMCSVAASMATMRFNRVFDEIYGYINPLFNLGCDDKAHIQTLKRYGFNADLIYNHKNKDYSAWFDSLIDSYERANEKGAMFDARCFNIPKEEVTNLIYWRQLDATRNSIQMVGQANFSHKELQGKSCNEIQNMLLTQKNINWNDFASECKRGSCCIKKQTDDGRSKWVIDKEIPVFKGDGRQYIESLIHFEDSTIK